MLYIYHKETLKKTKQNRNKNNPEKKKRKGNHGLDVFRKKIIKPIYSDL